METKDYLNYVVHEIHRTIVATVDDEGLPEITNKEALAIATYLAYVT